MSLWPQPDRRLPKCYPTAFSGINVNTCATMSLRNNDAFNFTKISYAIKGCLCYLHMYKKNYQLCQQLLLTMSLIQPCKPLSITNDESMYIGPLKVAVFGTKTRK